LKYHLKQENLDFSKLKYLIEYTTYYDQYLDSNRTHNIKKACQELNGLVIRGGETISFLGVVYNPEITGYKDAPIFVDGTKENPETGEKWRADGGGICQVSSTFHAVMLRIEKIEVVERYPHSIEVGYMKPGDKDKDATVYWPWSDLRIRNPYSVEIFVQASGENGCVKITLYTVDNE